MAPLVALVVKNLRIKRRRLCGEICCILLPIILATLLIVSSTSGFSKPADSVDASYDLNDLSVFVPASGVAYGRIAIADQTNNKAAVDAVVAALPIPSAVRNDAIVRLPSDAAVDDYCKPQGACLGGIVFTSASSSNGSWAYTLRIDTNDNLLKRSWPKDRRSTDSLLFLQHAVDNAILTQFPGLSPADINNRNSSVVQLYSKLPKVGVFTFWRDIGSVLLYIMCFAPVVQTTLQGMIGEKEAKLRESMYMMGLSIPTYNLS
eukprot:jgi/Hompol1/3485/HPOL_006564-RA